MLTPLSTGSNRNRHCSAPQADNLVSLVFAWPTTCFSIWTTLVLWCWRNHNIELAIMPILCQFLCNSFASLKNAKFTASIPTLIITLLVKPGWRRKLSLSPSWFLSRNTPRAPDYRTLCCLGTIDDANGVEAVPSKKRRSEHSNTQILALWI